MNSTVLGFFTKYCSNVSNSTGVFIGVVNSDQGQGVSDELVFNGDDKSWELTFSRAPLAINDSNY